MLTNENNIGTQNNDKFYTLNNSKEGPENLICCRECPVPEKTINYFGFTNNNTI